MARAACADEPHGLPFCVAYLPREPKLLCTIPASLPSDTDESRAALNLSPGNRPVSDVPVINARGTGAPCQGLI